MRDPKLIGRRGGHWRGTKYPVKAGVVFRLKNRTLKNERLGYSVEHYVVLWIMRVFKYPQQYKRVQDREIRVCVLKIPAFAGGSRDYLVFDRTMKERSITKCLKAGYEIIATDCKWYDKQDAAKAFYLKVQAALGVRLT